VNAPEELILEHFEINWPSDETDTWLQPFNKFWKVVEFGKELGKNNYLAIKCKLPENPTSFEIRFIHFNENGEADKILLHFSATSLNGKEHKFLLNNVMHIIFKYFNKSFNYRT
jgi:hypothetical protein